MSSVATKVGAKAPMLGRICAGVKLTCGAVPDPYRYPVAIGVPEGPPPPRPAQARVSVSVEL